MQFSINFTIGNQKGTLIDDFNPGIGMDVVNEVRDMIKRPSLEANRVSIADACAAKNGKLSIDIKKRIDLIDNAPQFKTRHKIKIYVRPGFFGRFMIVDTNIIFKSSIKNWFLGLFRRPKDINRVDISHIVNWTELLNEWQKDGYPSFWGMSEDDYKKKTGDKIPVAKEVKKPIIKQRKMSSIHKDLLLIGKNLTPNQLEEEIIYVKGKYKIK